MARDIKRFLAHFENKHLREVDEIPHGELEKHHYQALSDPMYQMECMNDVLRDDVMMNMPVLPEPAKELPSGNYTLVHIHRHMHQTFTDKKDTNKYTIS